MSMPVAGSMTEFFRGRAGSLSLLPGLVLTLALAGGGFWGQDQALAGEWSTWSSENISLDARQSFQMRVTFDDLPLRSWKLVVDGGDRRCDLSLLRVNGEELLYYKTDESRHESVIPWGKGEELIVVLTNRDQPAGFVVSLQGPPQDQITAAYSYHVNRALEAYATGQRLAAEDHCRRALKADGQDAVAKVLYAGFQRDRQFYENAAALVDEALEGELPQEMRTLAESLRSELVKLRAPLPAPVLKGLADARELLDQGKAARALELCLELLDGKLELDGAARSRILVFKGRSLEMLDRNFEAIDAYTNALAHDRGREHQALVHFHMGRLFLGMDNLAQARGALTISLQHGLPSGLELQARELLQDIENRD
jgi:tetratricopeptide (TPR) repeat protein